MSTAKSGWSGRVATMANAALATPPLNSAISLATTSAQNRLAKRTCVDAGIKAQIARDKADSKVNPHGAGVVDKEMAPARGAHWGRETLTPGDGGLGPKL